MKESISNDLDLDMYYKGHGPKQHLKSFSHRSLFIKKLLTKKVLKTYQLLSVLKNNL